MWLTDEKERENLLLNLFVFSSFSPNFAPCPSNPFYNVKNVGLISGWPCQRCKDLKKKIIYYICRNEGTAQRTGCRMGLESFFWTTTFVSQVPESLPVNTNERQRIKKLALLRRFNLKSIFTPRSGQNRAAWTGLLKRLLYMIIPGQVILQPIQQVPFVAIVETRWSMWRLLKQFCRFSSHLETIPSRQRKCKCKIHHCKKKKKAPRNRIWKAGRIYFYYSFLIPPVLHMTTVPLEACTVLKCSVLVKCFVWYTYMMSLYRSRVANCAPGHHRLTFHEIP